MHMLKERLVLRRNALNMSQMSLAEKAGISLRAVVSYEGGKRPQMRILEKLATALSVSPAWLLGAEDVPTDTERHSDLHVENVRHELRQLKIQAESLVQQISACESRLCNRTGAPISDEARAIAEAAAREAVLAVLGGNPPRSVSAPEPTPAKERQSRS
jgi:transcriptional regulator with XRE-family HTH domain